MNYSFPNRKEILKDKLKKDDDSNIYEDLIDKVKSLNIDDVDFSESKNRRLSTDVIEKQKEYLWLRVYLKEDMEINVGDLYTLNYIPVNETLNLTFISYGKDSSVINVDNLISDNVISNYDSSENKKRLIFMVDKDELTLKINTRKLFKNTIYYEDILLKRADLKLRDIELRDIEYVDMDF